ncbi:MAG: hypothetical protein VX473_03810 [Candidatus Thermoplasmatota archaeon]|nr:hypothetical protein [Candidatus Thermoplasmatota archaeon]
MAFHITGKIGVPVGIALLLLGVGITFSSFSIFEEAETIEDFMSEPSSEITKKFTDEDGAGSAGWYIMIQAEYFVDENDNNIIDVCEDEEGNSTLNLSIAESSGEDVDTAGTLFCELDDNRKLAGLDKENVDFNDGWMIVGIICDTLDNAEMNGYWDDGKNEGEGEALWVQTGENDRCKVGESYIIILDDVEMVLFDRDAQAALEVEGFFTLCGGICCAICSLLMVVVSGISGFAMSPGNSVLTTMELGGASPAPVSGDGTEVPGTTPGAVFGAGPPAQQEAVPLAEESDEESVESSADALKKQFLEAADKITESKESEKE